MPGLHVHLLIECICLHIPVTPEDGSLRQEDHEFQANLSYRLKACLKIQRFLFLCRQCWCISASHDSAQLSSVRFPSSRFPKPLTLVSICLGYVRMEIPCFFSLRELSEEWHFSVWLSMSHLVTKSPRSHVKCVQTHGRKHETVITVWCSTSPRFLPADRTICKRRENPCWKLDFYFNFLNFKGWKIFC